MPSLFYVSPELNVLILVIFIEWLLPLPVKYSPSRAFRILADAFVKKVATSGDSKQQTLAGWLALFTYLFLILVIVAALLFAMIDDVWTQAVLLYLALGYQAVANDAKQISNGLLSQQKQLARSLLKLHSPFQTDKLSALGLNKLTLEAVIFSFVSYWLMPIVMFLLIDGVAALIYRMIVEAYYCWFPLNPKTKHFGRAVFKIKTAIDFLPSLIVAPVYSVFKSSPGWTKLLSAAKSGWREVYPSMDIQLYWLSIVAAGCKAELAGPVMLGDKKLKRPKINLGQEVSEDTTKQLLSWNNRFRLFVVFVLALIICTLILVEEYGVRL